MRKEWSVDVFCGGERTPEGKGGRRQGWCVRTHLNNPGKSGSLSPSRMRRTGIRGRDVTQGEGVFGVRGSRVLGFGVLGTEVWGVRG